jgi:ferredoxin
MGAGTKPRLGRIAVGRIMKVKIVESLCIACGLCREVCPERAVHPKMQDIHHMYEVIESECTGCGDCLSYCPAPGALQEYPTNNS